MKLRVLAALTLVGIGSGLAAGGTAGLMYVSRAVWEHFDLLLLALAGSVLLATVMPRGTRAAPLAIALAGWSIHLWRTSGGSTNQTQLLLGGLVVLIGGWLGAAGSSGGDKGISIDPVRPTVAVLFPREVKISGEQAPDQLSVIALGTRVRVDLASVGPPRFAATEFVITCVAARIEVTAGEGWPIVGGRLAAAHGIRFTGRLDDTRLALYPQEPENAATLIRLAQERQARLGRNDRSGVLVIHIIGFGGEVVLVGR